MFWIVQNVDNGFGKTSYVVSKEKMKKKPKKYRNPLVVPAKTRGSSGPMRPKKDKRKKSKKALIDKELTDC